MRQILSKPFKIPVPGYELSGRFLGLRLSGPRRPLHDPDDPNALIVYSPPEMSEHDRLKVDTYEQFLYFSKYDTCSLMHIMCIFFEYIIFTDPSNLYMWL